MDLLFGTTNPGQAARAAAARRRPARSGWSRPTTSAGRCPRSRRTGGPSPRTPRRRPRRSRASPGCTRSRTTRGSAWTRSAARPASARPAGRSEEPGPEPASPVCELAGAAAAELGPVAGRAARDERNNDKLLAALAGVAATRAAARSTGRCSRSPARTGPSWRASPGACRGRIGHARRGDGGVRVRPAVRPRGGAAPRPAAGERARAAAARTMAELSPEEKDALSHRGEAFRRLPPVLEALAPRLDETRPETLGIRVLRERPGGPNPRRSSGA